jgi:hypothetical protein
MRRGAGSVIPIPRLIYVSTLEPIDEFGPLLRKEALRRGMSSAKEVVLLIRSRRFAE